MAMRACGLTAIGLLAAGASVPLLARAGDESQAAVALEFASLPGCPDAAEFERRIESRTGHLRHPVAGEPLRIVRAEITPTGGTVIARLELLEPDGRRSIRTLRATDCERATEALALVTAIAIDPGGAARRNDAAPSSTPGPTDAAAPTRSPPAMAAPTASSPTSCSAPATAGPTASSPTTRPAPATAGPTVSSPTTRPAPVTAGPAVSPPTTRPAPVTAGPAVSPPTTRPAPDKAVAWSLEGDADAVGMLGMAPQPTLAGALGVGLLARIKGSTWAPSVRAGAFDSLDAPANEPGGRATFGALVAFVDACPFRVQPTERVAFVPCAVVELGRLRAAGTGTPDPQSVPVRPWAAIGAALRLSLRVVGPLVAEASVGGLVAIDRDRFTWGSEVAFETPPVVGRATLGLSIVVP